MEPPHPQPQLATQLRYDSAAGGRKREQVAGRPHYGTTEQLPAAHGRARNGGGHGAVRFGPAKYRLSGVPEGDETDEGAGSPRGCPPQAAVPPRMYLSLMAWAVMAPLLVLGPQLGRYALEAPASLPAHQWQWIGVHVPPRVVKGAHLVQVSQKGIAKLNSMPVSVDPAGIGEAVKNAVSHTGGDNLLRTLSTPPSLRDGMVGDSLGPDHVGIQRTPYGTEIVRVGHTSIWNWGPFIFTLGARAAGADDRQRAGRDVVHSGQAADCAAAGKSGHRPAPDVGRHAGVQGDVGGILRICLSGTRRGVRRA